MGDCRHASRGAAAVVRSTQPLDIRTEAEDPCGAGGRARELAALDGRCGGGAVVFQEPQSAIGDHQISNSRKLSSATWTARLDSGVSRAVAVDHAVFPGVCPNAVP